MYDYFGLDAMTELVHLQACSRACEVIKVGSLSFFVCLAAMALK
jgi:hypothetical protein